MINSNELDLLSKAPDIRAIINEDTSAFSVDSATGLPTVYEGQVPKIYYNNIRIFLQNIGDRSSVIQSSKVYVFSANENFYKWRSFKEFIDPNYQYFSAPKTYMAFDDDPPHYTNNYTYVDSLSLINYTKNPSFEVLPTKAIFDHYSKYLLTTISLFDYSFDKKDSPEFGDVIYILIDLETEDNFTKKMKKRYISFELFKRPFEQFHKISAIIPNAESKLIMILKNYSVQ